MELIKKVEAETNVKATTKEMIAAKIRPFYVKMINIFTIFTLLGKYYNLYQILYQYDKSEKITCKIY